MLPGSLLRYHIKFKAAFAISVCCTAVAVRAFLSVGSLLDIYRLKALLNQHSMLVQVLILNISFSLSLFVGLFVCFFLS